MPSPARTSPGTAPPTPRDAIFAAQAPATPLTPAHAIVRPGRAGGRLADMHAPGAAPAATAAAIAEAAVAADAAGQAHEPASCDDEEMKTEESDADAAKAAAAQAAPEPNAQHLRPQDGPQDPVQATYAHDAAQFERALCAYVAADLATLVAHRRAAHRGTRFTDIFSSGCRCPLLFFARVAAASHARACAKRLPPAATVTTTTTRASEPKGSRTEAVPNSTTVHPPTRIEAAPPPTGPLTAAVAATATAASSNIAMAATANPQSAVPAAPKTPGRQHVPPVLAPAPARHVPAAAGKRRRLNSAEDEDMDAEQTTVTAPPPDPMTPPTPAEPALDPATAAAAPTATAPPPTARSTRWGPRPRAPDPTQATTGEPATDPAARRPLAPAAPVTGATRWGPNHRAIGAAAIARLVTGLPTAPAPPARRPPPAPSPPPSADEQQPAAMDVDAGTPAADDAADGPEPWLLRFDGACRRNPGPGGAGAALVDPSGKVVWTCSHYMPSSSETNNTAGYTALLLGVQSAVHHHAEQLTIEGDSHLVVTQVRGTFACRNQRLRQLRNRVRHALRSVPTYTLRHIDRKANAHADRLANRAFDLKRTLAECGMHQGAMADCLQPTPANQPQHERPAPPAAPSSPASLATAGDTSEDDEVEVAARDGGEVFPTIPIGPDSTPVRQPRLRLRPLSDHDLETAAAVVERFAAEMACRVTDADSWATGEGYIGAIPDRLREVLQPFASTPPTTRPPQGQQRQRPPRVTRNQREHRLDEALDDLAATQQATPTDSRAMRRARRRVGRIRSSMTQQQLRQDFVRDEAKCVARILRKGLPGV
ncbi:hypothetical protein PF008_g23523 [Phytophthora fragariae]|uniref:RNase H type-1 domain-containing protein n=1 Tax=Phytophthora fragariae TaxID=53985 RepID=A0A6G0QQK7_9STRA|nr:hypothetical protein PF008_g23523 [Phytophthora fragariae]